MPERKREVDVASWLRGLELERYAPALLDAEITPDALPELTDADLRELGLPLGPRKVLLKGDPVPDWPAPRPVGSKEEAEPSRAPTAPSQAERRQLTVMFVDLVGSTALSARLDPGAPGLAAERDADRPAVPGNRNLPAQSVALASPSRA